MDKLDTKSERFGEPKKPEDTHGTINPDPYANLDTAAKMDPNAANREIKSEQKSQAGEDPGRVFDAAGLNSTSGIAHQVGLAPAPQRKVEPPPERPVDSPGTTAQVLSNASERIPSPPDAEVIESATGAKPGGLKPTPPSDPGSPPADNLISPNDPPNPDTLVNPNLTPVDDEEEELDENLEAKKDEVLTPSTSEEPTGEFNAVSPSADPAPESSPEAPVVDSSATAEEEPLGEIAADEKDKGEPVKS